MQKSRKAITIEVFGFAGLFGLILGFLFGVGCAAAVMYTIYMGGYRKAVADSLQDDPCQRFQNESEKLLNRGDRAASR